MFLVIVTLAELADVALVALCGTLSVFVIPPLANLFSLSDATAGAWIGAAVHDVGQVIATASLMGPAALDSAVIVKLHRRISAHVMVVNEPRFTTLVLRLMVVHVLCSLRLSKTAMTARRLVLVLAAAPMDQDQPAI